MPAGHPSTAHGGDLHIHARSPRHHSCLRRTTSTNVDAGLATHSLRRALALCHRFVLCVPTCLPACSSPPALPCRSLTPAPRTHSFTTLVEFTVVPLKSDDNRPRNTPKLGRWQYTYTVVAPVGNRSSAACLSSSLARLKHKLLHPCPLVMRTPSSQHTEHPNNLRIRKPRRSRAPASILRLVYKTTRPGRPLSTCSLPVVSSRPVTTIATNQHSLNPKLDRPFAFQAQPMS